MSIVVAVTRVASAVAGGDQDITTADLGGLTPKAAYFIITRATDDGVAAAHAIIGIGAATDATHRWAVCTSSEDAQDTTDCRRRAMTDEAVLKILATDGTVDGEADFSAWIANGVTINWGNAPSDHFLLTVVFFAGTDLSAQAAVFTVAAVKDAATHVNTVGFEPDVLLTASHFNPFDDTAYGDAMMSYGVVTNKVAVEQYCVGWASDNGVGTSAVVLQVRDDYGVALPWITGDLILAVEFGTFDADGFSATTRLSAGAGEQVGFLALAFGGAADLEAGTVSSPVATGNQAITDPGFLPQFVMLGISGAQATDTHYSDTRAGTLGISTFDANEAYCNSIQDEDNQGVSDTQSLSEDAAIVLPLDTGAAGQVAAFVSLDSTGWTWNFTTVVATATVWWYLAIQGGGQAVRAANYYRRLQEQG